MFKNILPTEGLVSWRDGGFTVGVICTSGSVCFSVGLIAGNVVVVACSFGDCSCVIVLTGAAVVCLGELSKYCGSGGVGIFWTGELLGGTLRPSLSLMSQN